MTKMTAADLTDRAVIMRFKPIRVGGSIDRGAVTWVGLTRQQTPAERVVEAAREWRDAGDSYIASGETWQGLARVSAAATELRRALSDKGAHNG